MISLVTILVLGQAWATPPIQPPESPAFRQYRSDGPERLSRIPWDVSDQASFEFAPADGTGMGAACACVNPTGTRGETMTFTRASTAMCTKGNWTSGIVNGDLVSCANDQIRVMPGGDGTGALGVLSEITRTNLALRSQEIDNAAWTKGNNAGAAVPTVWANDAGAPDNTATADAVHFDATTGAQQSIVYQAVGNGINSNSVYLKGATPPDGGVAQSGSIDFLVFVASAPVCVVCSYSATTWTRCLLENQNTNLGGHIWMGNDSANCAGTKTVQDVLVWGAQAEAGLFVSSYIPTTSATVARAADSVATFTMNAAIGPDFSLAASAIWPSANATIATAGQLGTGTPNLARVGRTSNTSARFTINSSTTTPAVPALGTTEHRGSTSDIGGTRDAWWDGVSVTAPSASMTGSTSTAAIGVSNGVVKKLCVDPDPTRCR